MLGQESDEGLMTRIGSFMETTKGKVTGALMGVGLGFLTAVSPVSAGQMYDYNKSDYSAEEYMEQHFPDYQVRDVFRTVHEMMRDHDSEPERFVEEDDVEFYLEKYSEMADRHGNYDKKLDNFEKEDASENMRKVLPYFADFWLGDEDGRPESKEKKQFKKAIEQHESLIAASMVSDGDFSVDEYYCDGELKDYARDNISSKKAREVFYMTEDLYEQFKDFEPSSHKEKKEAKKYISEKIEMMASKIDPGLDDNVDYEDKNRLAGVYSDIRPEMIDYFVGDRDGVKEYWELMEYNDVKEENMAVEMVERFMDYYGD